jgi:hypothetical protein
MERGARIEVRYRHAPKEAEGNNEKSVTIASVSFAIRTMHSSMATPFCPSGTCLQYFVKH